MSCARRSRNWQHKSKRQLGEFVELDGTDHRVVLVALSVSTYFNRPRYRGVSDSAESSGYSGLFTDDSKRMYEKSEPATIRFLVTPGRAEDDEEQCQQRLFHALLLRRIRHF